jgi:hypothetical protein
VGVGFVRLLSPDIGDIVKPPNAFGAFWRLLQHHQVFRATEQLRCHPSFLPCLARLASSLWDATGKDALDVQRYVVTRGKFLIDRSPFLWTPKYKRHVIIPFIDNHKLIGWIARKIDPGKDFAPGRATGTLQLQGLQHAAVGCRDWRRAVQIRGSYRTSAADSSAPERAAGALPF